MSSTALPIASSGMSTAGTSACSSMSVRSTTVTSGESNATFSPGCTWRLATMPASGDDRDRIACSALRASCTCASADLTLPCDTFEARLGVVERVLRNEVLLQELLVGRLRLLGHRELRLRRFERAAALDELRLEVGGVDPREQLARPARIRLRAR